MATGALNPSPLGPLVVVKKSGAGGALSNWTGWGTARHRPPNVAITAMTDWTGCWGTEPQFLGLAHTPSILPSIAAGHICVHPADPL